MRNTFIFDTVDFHANTCSFFLTFNEVLVFSYCPIIAFTGSLWISPLRHILLQQTLATACPLYSAAHFQHYDALQCLIPPC